MGHTMLSQVMSLNCKHEEGIELFMTINDFNQVTRISLGKDLSFCERLVGFM